MRRRSLAGVLTAAVVALAMTATADVQSSAGSMACCAKTHGRCAGVKTADDCCAQMTHAAPRVAAVVTPGLPAIGPAATSSASVGGFLATSTRAIAAPGFKRPHDPPHLHAFALLI